MFPDLTQGDRKTGIRIFDSQIKCFRKFGSSRSQTTLGYGDDYKLYGVIGYKIMRMTVIKEEYVSCLKFYVTYTGFTCTCFYYTDSKTLFS